MTGNSSLRSTFDEVALLYSEARPHYPSELFSAMIDIAGLPPNARLLEIGPGTGQATLPLAQKGFDITAIELGGALAAVARRELRDYKNVQILHGAFEDATLPSNYFDLVYAATSFHWINASPKYSKTHDLLKDNGHLAIIHANHISDEDGDHFFMASLPVYDRYGYTDKHQKPKLLKKEELKPDDVDTRLFNVIYFRFFPVVITYTADRFVKLLNTFSNHLASEKETQRAFYGEIKKLINKDFEGRIDKHFAMSLTLAKKCN